MTFKNLWKISETKKLKRYIVSKIGREHCNIKIIKYVNNILTMIKFSIHK